MRTRPSLREKATALKRRHILDAAIRVFAARGFNRSTIHDVAVEAGVADGSIYNTFENKAALLLGILEARPGSVGDPSPAPVEDAAKFIRRLIEQRWAALTPDALAMLRVVLSEALVDPEIRQIYRETVIEPAVALPQPVFAALADAGEIVSADAGTTSRLLVATFFGLAMLRLLDEPVGDADATGLATLILDGLKPRSGPVSAS